MQVVTEFIIRLLRVILVDLQLPLSKFEFDESGHFLYCVRHDTEGGQRYKIDLQKAMVEIIDN